MRISVPGQGREDDELHHALAVGLAGLLAALEDRDRRRELVGHVGELHRRARVEPRELITRTSREAFGMESRLKVKAEA
jgi:hypothetical protein